MIPHPEPDILEWEVKWTLGRITTSKASGGDGIPVELFQILQMMLWKCCTKYASKSGKLNSGHRTGKGQFSSRSQRNPMPKNVPTTTQSYSSHTLAKKCSNVFKPSFNSTRNMNFQMFKMGLEKAKKPQIKLPRSAGSSKKQENCRKKIFLLYWFRQSLWLCGSHQTVENSGRDGITRPPGLPPEKSICRSRSNG